MTTNLERLAKLNLAKPDNTAEAQAIVAAAFKNSGIPDSDHLDHWRASTIVEVAALFEMADPDCYEGAGANTPKGRQAQLSLCRAAGEKAARQSVKEARSFFIKGDTSYENCGHEIRVERSKQLQSALKEARRQEREGK